MLIRLPHTNAETREKAIAMTETRDFPTAAIASLSTGILLCKFGDMHEAAEYLMGHPIWTHHFADKTLTSEMKRAIAEQCPGMPSEIEGVTEDNCLQKVAELEAEIGKTVKIRKGSGLTAMLPTEHRKKQQFIRAKLMRGHKQFIS